MSKTDFIATWKDSPARERAHYQQFFVELADFLGIPRPRPASDGLDYCFERPVHLIHGDGKATTGRIDLFRTGAVVLEFKQASGGDAEVVKGVRGTAKRGTDSYDVAMRSAFAQGRAYALSLPGRKVPFLMTCDIGYRFEIWSDFAETGSYGDYGARRTIAFADLADPAPRKDLQDRSVASYLRDIFEAPLSLDPGRRAAHVTREIARHLAGLARELELSGHPPTLVARFLMGCLFTMFAEDVGLLGEGIFTEALNKRWLPHPETFASDLTHLWETMDKGGVFGFHGSVLRFNGGLFRNLEALPLERTAIERLIEAAECDWSGVEPAIFGTLLERALDEHERAKLGAHFTPRAYIERLVKPTVIEPLRADWQLVQAQVRQLLVDDEADPKARNKAIALYNAFHADLCKLRILDPACGSGNFLYVTFDLLKQLEAEVLREMRDLGEKRELFGIDRVTVNPSQFLGIERNPRAREVADLVLWLGFLQWQRRAQGDKRPPEPVLREYQNIEARDAVMAYSREVPVTDEAGRPKSVWDMRTYKNSPITGERIPDEHARVPLFRYEGAAQAAWPPADFIIGNPPFVGNKMMRAYLGDGYAEALRDTWPEVPQTADLVMYWWERAARLVREGKVRRFGLITTNSITQVFNRKVIEPHLTAKDAPLAIAWAIPDHPWVDDGADVRIGMTVGARASDLHERPVLGRVTRETLQSEDEDQGGVVSVEVEVRPVDRIFPDLKAGADVAGAVRLRANMGLSFQGMNLVGKGFRLTPEEVTALGYNLESLPNVIRLYKNARDLTQGGEPRYVIDLYGLSQAEAAEQHPRLYQWLLERVKPERDQNKRESRRKNWWIFGEPVGKLRRALTGLSRYILTPETAKHRFFVFAEHKLCADHSLYAIPIDDAYVLGVLSSKAHILWSLAAGSTLEDRPRWRNVKCFDPFPFPAVAEAQKAAARTLAERLDAHRKRVEAQSPRYFLTAQYNALTRYREAMAGGSPLTSVERVFHDDALIGILAEIHDKLDAAVANAYGWPSDLSDDEILLHLVALNRERASEEQSGTVRWLRLEFQAPTAAQIPEQTTLPGLTETDEAEETEGDDSPKALPSWPKAMAEQLAAVRVVFATNPGALTAEEVARRFKRARRANIEDVLLSLASLGLLIARDDTPPRYSAPTRSDVG